MRFSSQASRLRVFAALAAVVLLAWFPSVRPRTLVGDDFHYVPILEQGLVRGSLDHLGAMGIWRWWGSVILAVLLGANPLVFPGVALLTHLGAVCLFYEVCRRVIGPRSGAFGAALIMAAMPVGYQAVMWASAYHYVLATLLFWLLLLVLLAFGETAKRQAFVFAAAGFLTISGALVHEALVFCALLCPVYLWCPGEMGSWRTVFVRLRERWGGLGPVLGGLLYVALYFGTLTDLTTKKPGAFNLPTIFSVYYHQLFQMKLLLAWTSGMVRQSAFENWSATAVGGAILLAVCAAWAVPSAARSTTNQANPPGLEPRRALVLLGSLLLGASLVYAAHGGFSRDSRKQYPIVYLCVLALAYAWAHWVPTKWKATRSLKWGPFGAVALEAATAWLMIGLWQSETRRSDALIQLMIERNIAGNVRIESSPDIYDSWSFMRESFGFSLIDEPMIRQAWARRPPLPSEIHLTRDSAAPLLSYDWTSQTWKYSGGGP